MVFRTQVNRGYLLLWNKRHGGKNGSRCSGVYDLGWRKLEFDLVVLLYLVKDWLPFESVNRQGWGFEVPVKACATVWGFH